MLGDTTRVREERRIITAMFADVVGSTALSDLLDPAEVKLVMGEAIACVVAEVDRLGGFVKDLAGDGMLAFFGAPVASEDDGERAVLAALATIEAIESSATALIEPACRPTNVSPCAREQGDRFTFQGTTGGSHGWPTDRWALRGWSSVYGAPRDARARSTRTGRTLLCVWKGGAACRASR